MIKASNPAKSQRRKAQYEAKFITWDWRKNLSESEWKYVASKLEERGDRDTEVYLHGRRILPKRVKKEISRHVRPTWAIPGIVHSTSKFLLVSPS